MFSSGSCIFENRFRAGVNYACFDSIRPNCTSFPAGRKLSGMNIHDLVRELREPAKTKIVLVVADGLGGLPLEPGGKTELETAQTPNLDAAAREGVTGLSVPVLPGITPGSGPG